MIGGPANSVVFMVIVVGLGFTPFMWWVQNALGQCGPLLLAACLCVLRVIDALFFREGLRLGVPWDTLFSVGDAFVQATFWAVFAMHGRPMRAAEVRVVAFAPAMAGVGGSAPKPSRKVSLGRVVDWWNRQPAPRAMRLALGCTTSAVIVAFMHMPEYVPISAVFAAAGASYAVVASWLARR